jgi:hypothetical protein
VKEEQVPTVLLPVTCPHCGLDSLFAYPLIVVITALSQWHRMALHAPCHSESWSATALELQRFREYLGDAWIVEQTMAHPVHLGHLAGAVW